MSVINTYTIHYQELKDGSHMFDLPIEASLFSLSSEFDIKPIGGTIHLELNKSGNVIQLHTAIEGSVLIPCDRCLDEVEIPLSWDGFATIRITDEQGEYDGDIIYVHPQYDVIDLTYYLYESIILSLPISMVHEDLSQCNPLVIKHLS